MRTATATALTLLLLVVCATLASAQSLKRLNIDPSSITVSGISSGAFMSVQFQVAHSKVIKGVGVVAGGPYWCAEGQIADAFVQCMYATMPIDVNVLINKAKSWSASGAIDSTDNLSATRAFFFSGTKDSVVNRKVVDAAVEFYQAFGTNITTSFNIPAQHSQVTDNYGSACSFLGTPYINNCGYDLAGQILTTLYAGLSPRGSTKESNLAEFSQKPYISGSGYTGMADTGYIYTPAACADGTTVCKLHFAFHGCGMNAAQIGNKYALYGGYNQWAESNNIVVVYPQAAPNVLKSNPNACWDWWGYTDANYCVKEGVQITSISNMISAIAGI